MMFDEWIKDLRQTGSNHLRNEITVLRSREIRGLAIVALAKERAALRQSLISEALHAAKAENQVLMWHKAFYDGWDEGICGR